MIPELRQTCKCEIFLVCKYIHIYVKVSITKILSYLKQKYVVRHILNSKFSTTCYAHYKDKEFQDGGFLHVTIKDAYQCRSCTPIKPKIIIHMNFSLGSVIHVLSKNSMIVDDVPNAPLIHFTVY